MDTDRFVIDMQWLSRTFKAEVMGILVPVEYYDTQATPESWKQYLGTADFVYQESLAQMFLIMSTDIHEFMSKLNVVLDMNYFMHIPAVMEPENVIKFKKLFTSVAFQLALYLREVIPDNGTGRRAEYLLENLTDSYALITKFYNEHNVEEPQ